MMLKKDVLSKLNRPVDRRNFLKACGALGVGAVAGGILQSKFDVVGLGRGLKKVSRTRIAMGTYVTDRRPNLARSRRGRDRPRVR